MNKNIDNRHSHLILMISLFSLLMIYPVVSAHLAWEILIDIFVIAILIFGVIVSGHTNKHFTISTTLALIFLILGWVAQVTLNKQLDLISSLAGSLFFAYVAVILLQDIFKKGDKVSMSMIYSAISIYLLIGLAFAFFYLAFSVIQPGSFSEPSFMTTGSQTQLYGFIYFSFVTLSTLGYGDVSPNVIQIAAFVYMEAIIGQLYLTIIIARLVGLQISQVDTNSDTQIDFQRQIK